MSFASAHPARIASTCGAICAPLVRPLPQHIPHGLHRSAWRRRGFRQIFASAHPARIASKAELIWPEEMNLCLSTSRTDCIRIFFHGLSPPITLPQHIPHGLHQQNRTDAMPQIHAICCELVDSFSDAAKAASALTIFCQGNLYCHYRQSRTDNRPVFRCEPHRKSLLAYASPNPHAGWGLRQCRQSLNRLVMKPHKLRIISFKGFLVKAF